MNLIYSVEQNDASLSSTYNWCSCGLSTGGIIGVVIGVVLGVIVIGLILYYCIVVRKRRQRRQGELRDLIVTKDMPIVPMTPNSLAYPVNNNDALAQQN